MLNMKFHMKCVIWFFEPFVLNINWNHPSAFLIIVWLLNINYVLFKLDRFLKANKSLPDYPVHMSIVKFHAI